MNDSDEVSLATTCKITRLGFKMNRFMIRSFKNQFMTAQSEHDLKTVTISRLFVYRRCTFLIEH